MQYGSGEPIKEGFSLFWPFSYAVPVARDDGPAAGLRVWRELSNRSPESRYGLRTPRALAHEEQQDASRNLPCLIVPKRHNDGRGWFSEIFHERRLQGLGIASRFVQDNQASSKCRGTLRGLHFQLPPAAQAKLVTVVRGRILDIAVDVRRGPPTFGKHVSAELSAEEGRHSTFQSALLMGISP